MMKNIYQNATARPFAGWRKLFFLSLFFFSSGLLQAQTFQSLLYGGGNQNEDFVAGVVLYDAANPTVVDGYLAVGNTNSYALGLQENIMVTRYDALGNMLWTKAVAFANPDKLAYHASDVQAASDKYVDNMFFPNYGGQVVDITGPSEVRATNKSDFYISGYYRENSSSLRKMLLVKIDFNGDVIWARADFANFTYKEYDEAAVSVEVSERDGDVFVVGEAANGTLTSHFIVARLNKDGRQLWCNRYFADNPCYPQNFELKPKQSCLYQDKFGQTGIAITGGTHYPLAKIIDYAFVSRINSDGTEAWRMTSLSGNDPGDDQIIGNDITLTKENNYIFGITGNLTKRSKRYGAIYSFTVDQLGAQLLGQLITSPQGYELSASSIRTDNSSGGEFVIAGRLKKGNDYYLLQLRTNLTSPPLWSWIYTTYPRVAIGGVERSYPSANGYFIATNSTSPFGTVSTGHVVGTDPNGKIVSDVCPHTHIDLKEGPFGYGIELWPVVVPDPYVRPIKTFSKLIEVRTETCQEQAFKPGAVVAPAAAMQLFPNPANKVLNVVIESKQVVQTQLTLVGLDGRLLETRTVSLLPGKNNIAWNIEKLAPGQYLIRSVDQGKKTFQQTWIRE